MHDFKSFMIKLTIDIIIVWAILLWIIAAFMGTKAHAGSEWTEDTYKLHNKLQELWMEKNLAKYVINRCKETAENPRRCVTTAAMIASAESWKGKDAYKNNVWGINKMIPLKVNWKQVYDKIGKKVYIRETYYSVYVNFDKWLISYNKFWYKSPLPNHFYSKAWEYPKTRYCTDEHSSGSKIGCPNGLRHATLVYNILNNF